MFLGGTAIQIEHTDINVSYHHHGSDIDHQQPLFAIFLGGALAGYGYTHAQCRSGSKSGMLDLSHSKSCHKKMNLVNDGIISNDKWW